MTTTTPLRPKSDGNSVWTRSSGAGTRFSHVDDDPTDDATYLSNPTGSAYQSLGMSDGNDVVVAANQRIEGIRVRVRWNFTGQGYLRVTFIRNGEITPGTALIKQASTSTSIAESETGLLTTDASGQEWTEGTVNTLGVRLQAASSNPAGRVRVYEVWTYADLNDQPTVTSTAVAAVTTSRPTVTYTYADTDGDDQTWRYVKVYPSSVFNAAGFDPDTSAGAVWTSEQATSETSFTVGADLQNGLTYRCYVKAAQDLNGDRWYSEWDFDEFTLGFDPPNSPSLTRTVDDPNARVLLDLISRTNWLTAQDASLEDTGTGTWSDLSNATRARSTAQSLHGAASLAVTASSAADMSVGLALYGGGFDRVRPDRTYSAVAFVRAAATARRVRLAIRWHTAASVFISETLGSSVWDSTSGWTPVTVSGVAPAGAAFWSVRLYVFSPASSEVHYLDEAGFWPGTAQPSNRLSTNGSGFEGGLDGWVANANATVTQSSTQALNGTQSMRLSSSASGTMSAKHTTAATSGFAVVGGGIYSAWAWFRAGSSGRSVRILIGWYDAAGALLSTTTGTSVTDTTTTWVRATILNQAAPAAARYALLLAEVLSTGAGSELHYVDDVVFANGTGTVGWGPGGGGFGATDVVTVLESQDTAGPNYLPANVADGGDTLGDTTLWFARDSDDRLEPSALYVYAGERGMLWGPSDAASVLDLGVASTSPDLTLAPLVAPGKPMIASAYVRAVSGTFSTTLILQPLDQYGQPTGSPVSQAIVATTSWQRVQTATLTIPDDGCYARVSLDNTGDTLTGLLVVDHAQLEVAASASATAADWEPGTGDRPDTWTTVRGGEVPPSMTDDQQAYIYDYEALPGTAVRLYRAYNYQLANDTTYIASEYAAAAAYQTPAAADHRWWLKVPTRPDLNRQVNVLHTVNQAVEEDTEEHHPLGRDGEAVVVSHWIGGLNGSVTVQTVGEAEWRAVERILLLPVTLLLQSPGGFHQYARPRSRDWPRYGGRAALTRKATISYTAVGRPPDV